MQAAETACWNIMRFGMQREGNGAKIIHFEICLLLNLLFILSLYVHVFIVQKIRQDLNQSTMKC
jgi:hypothetical protein